MARSGKQDGPPFEILRARKGNHPGPGTKPLNFQTLNLTPSHKAETPLFRKLASKPGTCCPDLVAELTGHKKVNWLKRNDHWDLNNWRRILGNSIDIYIQHMA